MATLSMFAIVTLFLHYKTIAGDHTNIISKKYSECTEFISPINETVVEDMHSVASCAVQCVKETRCVAFSVSATDDMCMLHREMFLTGICYSGNWRHYNVQNRCMNGGEYNQEKLTCQCYGGYIGQFCERIMQDCTEGYKTGHYTSGSAGIYLIQPNIAPTPFKVKCLMKYGGYTHAQQRNYGSADFYRSWQEYKDGFGDLSKDFWLGNDKIAYITNGRNQTLSFITKDMSTTFTRQQMYKSFTLSQDGLYRMTFERTWGHTIPEKSGGDCLSELKGQPFSTFDHDNDDSTLNCAQKHQSGFWFKNCTPCNPNGVWSDTPDGKRAGLPEEMFWIPVIGDNLLLSCTIYLQAI